MVCRWGIISSTAGDSSLDPFWLEGIDLSPAAFRARVVFSNLELRRRVQPLEVKRDPVSADMSSDSRHSRLVVLVRWLLAGVRAKGSSQGCCGKYGIEMKREIDSIRAMSVLVASRRARLWNRLRDGFRNCVGWWLEKIGSPAKLKVFESVDPATNQTVYLYTSTRFSVLCVGDRRFYFDRITGTFDGVSSPTPDSVSARLELRD
jgi:hypothetical protein